MLQNGPLKGDSCRWRRHETVIAAAATCPTSCWC